MLSLVFILCLIGLPFSIRKWNKHKRCYYRITVDLCIVVSIFLIPTLLAMFTVVNQNDTGYLNQQIDTLTEVNKQIEDWIEIIKNDLSDNPQLSSHVQEYLNGEISSNNEEINRCMGLQKNRVKLYRWLLYFG